MIFNKREKLMSYGIDYLAENIFNDYQLINHKSNELYFKEKDGEWEKYEVLSEEKYFILNSNGYMQNKRKK